MNKKIKELSIYGGTSLGWLEDAEEVEKEELLLKDLCARLPYELLVKTPDHFNPQVVNGINNELEVTVQNNLCYSLLFEAKPYLRPMSSISSLISAKEWTSLSGIDLIDWYNANHIDYRGLIEKGLAIEAPEGMYDTSQKWTSTRSGLKENENGQIVGGVKL